MNEYIRKYLFDILDAASKVEDYRQERPRLFAAFCEDVYYQAVVKWYVTVTGEAVNKILKIDPAFALSNAKAIISTRNRFVHGYDSIDVEMLWALVITHLPALRKEVQALLDGDM
jgi:uncharacterized protein with HEPN domain